MVAEDSFVFGKNYKKIFKANETGHKIISKEEADTFVVVAAVAYSS